MVELIMSMVMVFYNTCSPLQQEVWLYSLNTKAIYVCENYEENNWILYHEFSHWIYFNKLTEEERLKWVKLYSKPPYISDYAGTKPEEDWAEEWRVYFQKWKVKNTIKRSFVRRMMKKYGFDQTTIK